MCGKRWDIPKFVAPGPHDKAGKTHRAQRFAAWLLKIYGEEAGWPGILKTFKGHNVALGMHLCEKDLQVIVIFIRA